MVLAFHKVLPLVRCEQVALGDFLGHIAAAARKQDGNFTQQPKFSEGQ